MRLGRCVLPPGRSRGSLLLLLRRPGCSLLLLLAALSCCRLLLRRSRGCLLLLLRGLLSGSSLGLLLFSGLCVRERSKLLPKREKWNADRAGQRDSADSPTRQRHD